MRRLVSRFYLRLHEAAMRRTRASNPNTIPILNSKIELNLASIFSIPSSFPKRTDIMRSVAFSNSKIVTYTKLFNCRFNPKEATVQNLHVRLQTCKYKKLHMTE